MGLTGGVKSHRLSGQISPYCEKKTSLALRVVRAYVLYCSFRRSRNAYNATARDSLALNEPVSFCDLLISVYFCCFSYFTFVYPFCFLMLHSVLLFFVITASASFHLLLHSHQSLAERV